MPHTLKNKVSPSPAPARTGASFRKRYDELERRREALMKRLGRLSESTRAQPSCRRALKLLNETFRKSSLAQRVGVLQAASWMLDVIERLSLTL